MNMVTMCNVTNDTVFELINKRVTQISLWNMIM